MTDRHNDLEELFALARHQVTSARDGLSQRVLADAHREMPPVRAEQTVVVQPRSNGFFGLGWPSFAGLAATAVLGLTIGVQNPTFSDSLLGSSYSISDLMPGFGVDFTDEAAG